VFLESVIDEGTVTRPVDSLQQDCLLI